MIRRYPAAKIDLRLPEVRKKAASPKPGDPSTHLNRALHLGHRLQPTAPAAYRPSEVQKWKLQRLITIGDSSDSGQQFSAKQAFTTLQTKKKLKVTEQMARAVLKEWSANGEEFDDWDELAKDLEKEGGYDVKLKNGEILFVDNADGDTSSESEQVENGLQLMRDIKQKYGIEFDSQSSIKAAKQSIFENREELHKHTLESAEKSLKQMHQESWEVEDLQALADALAHFAPILGKARSKSPRKGVEQEIVTVGKVDKAATFPETLAETFPSSRNITLYEEGQNEKGESPNKEEKTATMIHELTHGLLEHRLGDFRKMVKFWPWISEQFRLLDAKEIKTIGDFKGEKPPTAVAKQNAAEDLAECVSLFFSSSTSQKLLKQKFPERFKAVTVIVSEEMGK